MKCHFLQSGELLQISNIWSKWTPEVLVVRQIPACSLWQYLNVCFLFCRSLGKLVGCTI